MNYNYKFEKYRDKFLDQSGGNEHIKRVIDNIGSNNWTVTQIPERVHNYFIKNNEDSRRRYLLIFPEDFPNTLPQIMIGYHNRERREEYQKDFTKYYQMLARYNGVNFNKLLKNIPDSFNFYELFKRQLILEYGLIVTKDPRVKEDINIELATVEKEIKERYDYISEEVEKRETAIRRAETEAAERRAEREATERAEREAAERAEPVARAATPSLPIEDGDKPLPNEADGLIEYELAILKLAKYKIEPISKILYKITSPDNLKFIVQFSTTPETVKPKILFEGYDIYDYLLRKKESAGLDPTSHYQIIKLILEEIPYPDTRELYIREIAEFEQKRNKIRELEEKKRDLEKQISDIDTKFEQKKELFKELRLYPDLKNNAGWKGKYKILFDKEFELTKLNESNFYWILLIPKEVDIGNKELLNEYIKSIKKDARKYSGFNEKYQLYNAEKEKIKKEKEIIDQRIKENNELHDKLNIELSDDKDEQDKKDKLKKLEEKYEQFNKFIKRANIFPIPIKELTEVNLNLNLLPNADLYELEDKYNKKIANLLEKILESIKFNEFYDIYTEIYLLYKNQSKIMFQIWFNIKNSDTNFKKLDKYTQINTRKNKLNTTKNTTEEILKKIEPCNLLNEEINTIYPAYIKSPINIENIRKIFDLIKKINECYIPIIKLFNDFNDDRKEYKNLLDDIRMTTISKGCEKLITIINKEILELSKSPEFQKLLEFIGKGKYEKSKILEQLDKITKEYLDEIIIEEKELSESEKKEYEEKISKQILDLLKLSEFQELLKLIDKYEKNIRSEKYDKKTELLDTIKFKIDISLSNYQNNKKKITGMFQYLETITKELSETLVEKLSESKKTEFIKNNEDIIEMCDELTKLFIEVRGIIRSFYANLDNLNITEFKEGNYVKTPPKYVKLGEKLNKLMKDMKSEDSIDFFKILNIKKSEIPEEQLNDLLGDSISFWAHIKGMATKLKKLYNKEEQHILHIITYYDTLPPDIKKIYNKSIEKLRELRSLILVLFNI